MRKKQKKIVQIIAIILVVLLAGSAIVSAVISMASAEELPADQNLNSMKIEYLEEEQTLRITQRLVYFNTTGETIDHVYFQLPANAYLQESSLFYEEDMLHNVFPDGYSKGGADAVRIAINGTETVYEYIDPDRTAASIPCTLGPDEKREFSFDYDLKLPHGSGTIGYGISGVHLSGFYFTPLYIDLNNASPVLQTPTAFTRYVFTPSAAFDVQITLPEIYSLFASGTEERTNTGSGTAVWQIRCENARDFAIVFGPKYKVCEGRTDSGVQIRCASVRSGKEKKALEFALEAVHACEEMFGPFPAAQFDIIETDYAPGDLNSNGILWLSEEAFRSTDLQHTIRRAAAQQYFGLTAYAQPGADAWLSDSVSEYIAYLITDRSKGHKAYLKELNSGILNSLNYTIPGSLRVNTDASMMTANEYKAVIRDRGACVFHEMAYDMGTEELINGLRAFYEMGKTTDILTEMDMVRAFDSATGGHWEKALTDWVFNIGEYVNQGIDMLD